MLCAIWYYLYNLKNVKIIYTEVLFWVKLHAEACHLLKVKHLHGCFFAFFKEVWYNKLVDEISSSFPELFIIGKYVKMRFKNRGSPSYFLSSRGQKIKNITKMKQERLSLFTILVSFFITFLAQKLIYTINIWLKFVFGSFFEQDNLLKWISQYI